eukprot:ctg_2332.g441
MSASVGEVPGSVRRQERRETPRAARAGSGRLRTRSDPSSTRSLTPGLFPRGEVDEAGVRIDSIDSRAWGEAAAFQAYRRELNELDERYAWEQRELFTDVDGSFSFDGCLVAGQAGTPPRQVRAQIALWFTDVARMLQFAARTAAIGFRVVQRALLALAQRSPPSPDDAGDANESVDATDMCGGHVDRRQVRRDRDAEHGGPHRLCGVRAGVAPATDRSERAAADGHAGAAFCGGCRSRSAVRAVGGACGASTGVAAAGGQPADRRAVARRARNTRGGRARPGRCRGRGGEPERFADLHRRQGQ